jgi:hypothetical protein
MTTLPSQNKRSERKSSKPEHSSQGRSMTRGMVKGPPLLGVILTASPPIANERARRANS